MGQSSSWEVLNICWPDRTTTEPTNQKPNSTEQSTSWEAKSSSPSQEIPHILWNPKVHYRIHKCLLPALPWARSIQSSFHHFPGGKKKCASCGQENMILSHILKKCICSLHEWLIYGHPKCQWFETSSIYSLFTKTPNYIIWQNSIQFVSFSNASSKYCTQYNSSLRKGQNKESAAVVTPPQDYIWMPIWWSFCTVLCM